MHELPCAARLPFRCAAILDRLTFGGNNLALMGEMNEVFAAQDDETAIAMLEGDG